MARKRAIELVDKGTDMMLKSTIHDLYNEDQEKDLERLKGTIAEVVSKNLELKKEIGERLQRKGRR